MRFVLKELIASIQPKHTYGELISINDLECSDAHNWARIRRAHGAVGYFIEDQDIGWKGQIWQLGSQHGLE